MSRYEQQQDIDFMLYLVENRELLSPAADRLISVAYKRKSSGQYPVVKSDAASLHPIWDKMPRHRQNLCIHVYSSMVGQTMGA